jgi:magnesium transporter
MLSNPQDKSSDIMDTKIIFAYTTEDQEAIADLFKRYSLLSLPVVDKEQRLVGIVTVDDIVQVIEEEATEDFEKMSALNPSEEPYMKTGVFKQSRNRIFWLIFLMLSATITGSIISGFQDSFKVYPILIAFIPMLMDTGGNAGSQSSTLIIRGIALDEIHFKDTLYVLWREIRVGALCGLILGTVNFVRVYLMNSRDYLLSFAVSISLIITVIMSKSVGCILPLVAKKMKFDPAIMAAPIITTIVDGASLIVYFSVAKMILNI